MSISGSNASIQEMKKHAGILIQQCLQGQLSFHESVSRWPADDALRDQDLDTAFHALQHFAQDADIRAKDEEYARMQQEALADIAQRLMDNRSVDPEQAAFLKPRMLNPFRWLADWLIRRS